MLSLTEYILRTIDCEFAFDKCNNFCEKDTLETLVAENSAFKEKDVEKNHHLCYDIFTLPDENSLRIPIFHIKKEFTRKLLRKKVVDNLKQV